MYFDMFEKIYVFFGLKKIIWRLSGIILDILVMIYKRIIFLRINSNRF